MYFYQLQFNCVCLLNSFIGRGIHFKQLNGTKVPLPQCWQDNMPKKDGDGFSYNSLAELFAKFHSSISAEVYGKQWKISSLNQNQLDCIQGTHKCC